MEIVAETTLHIQYSFVTFKFKKLVSKRSNNLCHKSYFHNASFIHEMMIFIVYETSSKYTCKIKFTKIWNSNEEANKNVWQEEDLVSLS